MVHFSNSKVGKLCRLHIHAWFHFSKTLLALAVLFSRSFYENVDMECRLQAHLKAECSVLSQAYYLISVGLLTKQNYSLFLYLCLQ